MAQENTLSYLNDVDRLRIYNSLVSGNIHVWSKGKLQQDKLQLVLDAFMTLAEKDPLFLAHLNSWLVTRHESKDLKVVSTFINSLNDADGTPFYAGSKYKKPNYRLVAQAAVQALDPKLALRVATLANLKLTLGTKYKEGTHFSRGLKKAITKYIKYREQNPKAIEGLRKAGLAKTFQQLYRLLHASPSMETAAILGWNQKKGGRVQKKKIFNFEGLTDLQVAEKIRSDRLAPQATLGALDRKISPVIAAAILEQCSGDQAVIYRELFDKEGLLKDKEVLRVFSDKIRTAKTALDRVDKITTDIDEDVKKELKTARAEKRKEITGDLGKIFLHIDISGSMDKAIAFAKEKGSIIAECVNNPEKNFFWGLFNSRGHLLRNPETFEKDAFMAALYGVKATGNTNCLACYPWARENGCEVDVYVTDQGHNDGNIASIVAQCRAKGWADPKVVVIVDFSSYTAKGPLQVAFESLDIPVSIIKPNALTESALVAQAVGVAIRGAVAIIDDIMATPLLELPQWWQSIA
jgi:hypothetical protein